MIFQKKDFFYLIVFFLVLPFIRRFPFYSHNQNTYFVKGFFKAGFLQNDWLANEESTTSELDWIVATTLKFFPSSAELIFQFFFLSFIIVFLYSLKRLLALFGTKEESFYTILLSAGLFFTTVPSLVLGLLGLPIEIAQIPFNGLAGHSLIGYFQPSIIGVVLITGLYFFLEKRYLLAAVIIMFTSVAHAPNILFAFLAMLFILYEVIIDRNWKLLFKIILLSIPFASIILFKHIGFIDGKNELRTLANEIYINERSPHHHVIKEWIKSESDWVRMISLLFGTWLFTGRLKRFYIFMMSGIVLLTIIQFLSGSQSLALLEPWRLTVVWIPLITAFLILKLLQQVNITQYKNWKWYFIGTFFVLNIGARWYTGPPSSNKLPLNKDLSALAGTLLIPPKGEWGEKSENVRLNYLIPVFIDFKSHPYSPEGLIEWKKRNELANQFYLMPTVENLQSILAEQKIDYIIWPEYLTYKPQVNSISIVESIGFKIYELP